jgi:hypothetical protein
MVSNLDVASLEKMLLFGAVLIVAALVGGGLDAAGIIKLPAFRDWRTQSGVGLFGAVIIVFSVFALGSANFATNLELLENGAAGIPPPQWPSTRVQDALENLSVEAAEDPNRNCEIANFIAVHTVPLPLSVTIKLQAASNGGNAPDLACYRDVVDAAKAAANQSSSMTQPRVVQIAENDSPYPITDVPEAPVRLVAQKSELAAPTARTNILEAIAAVGQQGWMYLGRYQKGALGSDRTITNASAAVGQTISIKTAVNLREVGSDTNYRTHKIVSVIPPRSTVAVEALTPTSGTYGWARVHIVSLPK